MPDARVQSVSEEYLYLTTTGRVTGKPREIEIWFVESGGKFYVLAEHRHTARWVRNNLKNPYVHVRVGARARRRARPRGVPYAQRLMRAKYD